MAIRFYKPGEIPYGVLSNFSSHGVHLDGQWWPTVEHYYQAAKFRGAADRDAVRQAATPSAAWRTGNDRKRLLRDDWQEVRVAVMRRALRCKFVTHPDALRVLLQTGDEDLMENTRGDHFWGCGRSGSGQNMLGKLLMELRVELSLSGPLPD